MDNKTLAKEILRHVGGAENVKYAQHCATRLVFNEGKPIDTFLIPQLIFYYSFADGWEFYETVINAFSLLTKGSIGRKRGDECAIYPYCY